MQEENDIYYLLNESFLDIFKVILLDSSTIEDIAEKFLEKAKSLTGSKYGYVNTIDPATGLATSRTISKMMGKECHTEGTNNRIIFGLSKNGKYPSLWGVALNKREAFFTNNPSQHKNSNGVPNGHIPIKNFLSVPVISNGDLIGQIAVANSEREYSKKDLELVKKLCDLFVLSLKTKDAQSEREIEKKKISLISEKMFNGLWQIDKNAYTTFVNSKM